MKSRLNPALLLWAAMVFLAVARPVHAQEIPPGGKMGGEMWRWKLAGFGKESYSVAVQAMLARFEERTGQQLIPGDKGRAGLKVYTASGSGLATPKNLVDAVIAGLLARGFSKTQLFILDQSERNLRNAGYLPPLSHRRVDYQGVQVIALDTGSISHPDWFYDSPLPSYPLGGEKTEEDRKSLLPYPLVAEVDFWINLPAVVDCPGLGVSASIANASIWNVLNHQRFLADKTSAPVAATEIAAIPELLENCALTLMPLEKYQFIGGPNFHSLYTASEPELCLSTNMVLLDHYITRKMNIERRNRRFESIPLEASLFQYGKALGLGDYEEEMTRAVLLNPGH